MMCVVKEIRPNDPIWSSDLAKAAIAKELKGLQDRKTSRFGNPRCWKKEVSKNEPDAQLVGFKVILGIKHSGMPEDKWKCKARGCATGNHVVDSSRKRVFEDPDDLIGRPAAMTAARLAMIRALMEKNSQLTASDVCQAHI